MVNDWKDLEQEALDLVTVNQFKNKIDNIFIHLKDNSNINFIRIVHISFIQLIFISIATS